MDTSFVVTAYCTSMARSGSQALVVILTTQLLVEDKPLSTAQTEQEKAVAELPKHVELWVDVESGVALKVFLDWFIADSDQFQTMTVEFQEEVELADPFFTPDMHGGKNRPRIQFGDPVQTNE